MSDNRTFFKNVRQGSMTLGDIFADVTKKHTAKETAQVLTAGTPLTTPREAEMLAGWQKPFLFARFFLGYGVFLLLCYAMGTFMSHPGGLYLLMVGMPFLVPVTLLMLVFEMNVPRNISLYEIITIVGIGGIISLIATLVLEQFDNTQTAVWAGLTEEPAKLLVVYLVLRQRNYKYAVNGALIGIAVGTGFAVLESIFYVINYVEVGIFNGLCLFYDQGMSLADAVNNIDVIWNLGVSRGLDVALARAVTAISGHGVWAALYGSALVKAKGSDEITLSHLLKPEFLLYFGLSIALHALHNSGLSLGLPVLLDGLLPCEYIITAFLSIGLLVYSLRIGVNQVVEIGAAKNGGRVTMAVNRSAGAPTGPVSPMMPSKDVQLQCIAGPSVGQTYRCREGQSLTIGRVAGKSDIALPGCESVSGAHCRIDVVGGRVNITDLNSTNGTYLDNQRLAPNTPMPALDGSTIYLGNKTCAFRIQIR